MAMLDSNNLFLLIVISVYISISSCASQKRDSQAPLCYKVALSTIAKSQDLYSRDIIVNKEVVEFNYYASLFADTISQIIDSPIDSLLVFNPKNAASMYMENHANKNEGVHTLFFSNRYNNFFFIEQIENYREPIRPDFGSGIIHLMKCNGSNVEVIFSKEVSFN